MELYLIFAIILILAAYHYEGFKYAAFTTLFIITIPIWVPLWLLYKGGRWVLSSELRILGLIGFISFLVWLNSKLPDPFG